MSGNKPLKGMTKEELLVVCENLIAALEKKRQDWKEAMRDLPPNKAANDRHQRHKLAWGRRKTRMLALLADCQDFILMVDSEYGESILDRIKYELDVAEKDYQMRFQKEKTRRAIRHANKA